ncbi:MAG TPA: NPCBM/NEW2 domain-containing protein [Pirellulales bacterium]|jgi:hypothetical protein|nr:NPCBM/NEW2 domain-containing protein [Pirellulales bacterium]
MKFLSGLAAGAIFCFGAVGFSAQERGFELHLRSRDAGGSKVSETVERLDPAKTGIVIVDMWNYHHCMTAEQRVGAMVPRMNRALEGARKFGMKVIWAPTDVADLYVGTPQRERAMAVAERALPKIRSLPWCGTLAGQCLCGPGFACPTDYGWDGMHPDLIIAPQDYIVGRDAAGMYSLCEKLGLTQLIYMGVHTNFCVLGKGPAIKNMYDAGLRCFIARDLTDALTEYDPAKGFTPDTGTARVVRDLERSDIPSINMGEEMKHAGVWDAAWITEPVRITPWGTAARPYQFRDRPVTVSLTAPWLEGAEIHYTLDGSAPTAASPRYEHAISLNETTTLRCAAFRGGACASIPTSGFFCKLPSQPPQPELAIAKLKSLEPKSGPNPLSWPVRIGQAQDGARLSIRGREYSAGCSGRAPSGIRWKLEPRYDRFVALAGVDDAVFRMRDHAFFLGRYCSVVFEVYIDGQLAAKSPAMRLSQEPWPFDVKIPPGSTEIHIVATTPGTPNPYSVGDWVDAGFVLKHSADKK